MPPTTITAQIQLDRDNFCEACEGFEEVIYFHRVDQYGSKDWYFCVTCLDTLHSNIRDFYDELKKGEPIQSAIWGK